MAEEHLIDAISNVLKEKRYLVIIDDIWHWGEWETINKSLPDNDQGSRIVTTSRVNAITEKWHYDFNALVHGIYYRAHEDVFSLFTSPDVDMDEGIRVVVNRILDMCDGMPLAVDCMVSALAKERERREQHGLCVLGTHALQDEILKQVMGNGIQNTPGFEPLVESLELGYKDLPHHMLKTCLLYCSIYPEDHYFIRDDFVSRWIAEGFVRKEEAAKYYFDELVSRGLFHEHERCYFLEDERYYETTYRVHPMMRNYLRRKLREDNFITCTSDSDVPSSPVGRLWIDYWPSSDAVEQMDPLSGIDLHHIRSLVVFEHVERVPYKLLQRLRVLDAQVYHGALENQHLKDMCGLLRQRHLFVSQSDKCAKRITEIPADIAKLQHLETFHVTSTNITRLPAEIGDLRELKTLDVRWNRELAVLPREMGNLQCLETLCIRGSNIREQAWGIIGRLEKLKTLDVSNNPELSSIPKDIGELQHLKMLNLSETRITELPHEIGNLQRLVHLEMCYTNITKVPRDIVKLQHLESLVFWGTNVTKMPREIWGLQNLKYLKGELGILRLEAGQLSKLEGLPKCVREAGKNSLVSSSLAGEIITGDDDGTLVIKTKHMHIPRWIKEHFNNIPTLDIRICKLEEQDLKILQEMPNLRLLVLRFEGVARKPIVISSGGFANLGFFVVDSRVPRITFQEGAMPMLRTLGFQLQFYGGSPNKDPMGIKHLVSLECVIFGCSQWYRADSPCNSATIDVVRKEATEHPNEIRLQVSGRWDDEIFPAQDRNEASSSGGAEGIEDISENGSEACSSSGAQEIEEIRA